MRGETQGSRRIAYCLLAAALPMVAFSGWRLFVSQFGTSDQFLWFAPAHRVRVFDQAIEEVEQEASRVGPQSKEKEEIEEDLRQLKRTRERLAQDRDARIPEGRRTERVIGVIGIMAGAVSFGWGFRRLSRSG